MQCRGARSRSAIARAPLYMVQNFTNHSCTSKVLQRCRRAGLRISPPLTSFPLLTQSTACGYSRISSGWADGRSRGIDGRKLFRKFNVMKVLTRATNIGGIRPSPRHGMWTPLRDRCIGYNRCYGVCHHLLFPSGIIPI